MGPSPVLGQRNEMLLVNWIKQLAQKGFPIRKHMLVSSVEKIVSTMEVRHTFSDGRPGKKWVQLFLNRHPDIAFRCSEKLSRNRALLTPEILKKWFVDVEKTLQASGTFHVLQDPSRVFNLDESGFSLCPKGDKVLGIKGQKNVYELADRDKENVTVLLNVSASGVLAPPMAVFAGKRFPKGLNEENRKFEVTNWSFAFSENGWITGQVFFEYMANTFYKWLLENNIAFPVIVFLDGHSSHLTYHLSQFCSQVGIEIVALFPNATHLIQPLDVAVFGPLKKKWAMEVDRWRVQNNVFSITKVQLPGILSKVLKNELKTESIINGFRVCGLYPFNKDSVDFSKCRTASFSVQPPAQKPCKLTLCGHSYLEKVIGEEKLKSFKTGNVSGDEAIYDLWMKSKLLLEETSIEHDNAAKDTVSECSRTIPVMEEMHVASEIAHVNVAPGEPSSKIPSKMEMAISPETGGLNVPTPFKKYLYWPGTPKKKNTVRRTLNLPTVVTCGQWQD